MKIVLKIISYIIAFVLMIAILVGIISQISVSTILNKEYVLGKLEGNKYYENTRKSLLIQLEDYVEQSGLEAMEINKLITEDLVKKDIDSFFSQLYSGEEISVSKDELKEKLQTKLESLEQSGNKFTSSEKKEAEKVFDTVVDNYFKEVSYSQFFSYLKNIPKTIAKINDAVLSLRMVIFILIPILALIILLINIKQLKLGLKYIGIAILASGILMVGINIFVNLNINIQSFYVLNKAISDMAIALALDCINALKIIEIICIILGIVLIIIGATYQKKKNIESGEEGHTLV